MLSLCFVSGDMCGIVSAENGNVSCFQNPNNQECCLLTCYPGYTVVSQGTNSHQFHCNKTKGWDGGVPSCDAVSCGSFPTPSPFSGSIICSGTKFNDFCSLSCPLGYILAGDRIRTCQENGVWSNTNMSCVPVKCPPLVRFMYTVLHVNLQMTIFVLASVCSKCKCKVFKRARSKQSMHCHLQFGISTQY